MTRGDILTKVVAIAKRKGFEISDDFFTEIPVEAWIRDNQDLYFSIIFCHDFSFYFFGSIPITVDGYSKKAEEIDLIEQESPMGTLMSNRKNIKISSWQYHMIQMLLSEDPLEYLSKFIKYHESSEVN